jgi:dihydroorotate dehydrogenase (NAD+) catalytic subunit
MSATRVVRRRARAATPSPASAFGRAPGARVDMTVRIGPLTLANPVLTASGTFGYGDEYAHVVDLRRLGGVITKTVTLQPRAGNPPVRIAETAGGMLNSIGLENVGVARFRSEKLPKLAALGAVVVASVGGETPRELERLLEALGEERGIAGFEINFSCPNVAKGGARYWAVARRLERTMKRLRPLTRTALIAKLSPDVTSVGDLAIACEQGGADAVTAVNTFVGMAVDLAPLRHRLNRATGGLSGPAIKPLALARCHEAAAAVSIPVIGSGGIMSGRDALEFIAVGAAAVQVGTASFVKPSASADVLQEMIAFLAARGVKRVEDWRGRLAGGTAVEPRNGRQARRGGARS